MPYSTPAMFQDQTCFLKQSTSWASRSWFGLFFLQSGSARLVHNGLRLGAADVSDLMVASLGLCLSLVLAAAGGFCLVQATATGGVEAHLPRGVYSQKKAVSGADPQRGFQVSFRQPALNSPVEELHGFFATGSLRNKTSPRL